MIFNSILFIFLFMPIVIGIYYVLPDRYRPASLIIASLFFYVYNDLPLTLNFLGFIFLTYAVSRLLKISNYSKWMLGLGLVGLVSYLLYFKYLNFLTANLNSWLGPSVPMFEQVALPLGVSFFTFSAISYLIDSYRTKTVARFIDYLHYITFFPKLISGPLVSLREFNYTPIDLSDLSAGLARFIVGLSKKVIFAYYFGVATDAIWAQFPQGIDVPTAWLGATLYSLQIYFDFSGYSDMAIGLGRIFGYRLPENFNFPYLSQSITEYWKRWHITLGRWFGRYVYIPLGGSRRGNVYLNLFIVFLVSGLWHGANWTFIVWGLWHALFRLIEQALSPTTFYEKIPSFIKWSFTMVVLLISRVIFRSIDIQQAWEFSQLMFGIGRLPETSLTYTWQYFLNQRIIIVGIIGLFGSTVFAKTPLLSWWQSLDETSNPYANIFQTILLAGLAVVCIMMIISSEYVPFIYFRF